VSARHFSWWSEMRILHAPLNIANEAWSMSRAQRVIGAHSDLATTVGTIFSSPPDFDLSFRGSGVLSRQFAKAAFVRKALRDYDVFHYAFGASILDYGDGPFELMDLKWAHNRGKCVAMTLHGCDVRPTTPGGCDLCEATCNAERASRRLEKMRRWVDLFYVTTPDLLVVVPEARLLPASVWGLAETEVVPPRIEGPLRIVHAPSDRRIKGTAALLSAVDSLRAEGLDIDLTLVEGVPHEQALELYRLADLGVDQLRAGWYGVFAVEMAAMGKPVVTSIAPEYVAASGMAAPPFSAADEDNVGNILRDLANHRTQLPAMGARAREFVIGRHGALANAKRVVTDYADACGKRAGTLPSRR
jgi:hypothetical protein